MISNLWIQIIILFCVILIFYHILTVRFSLKQPEGVIIIIWFNQIFGSISFYRYSSCTYNILLSITFTNYIELV